MTTMLKIPSLMSLVWLLACASNPQAVVDEEVDAVSDGLRVEMLDVLDSLDPEEYAVPEGRERLIERLGSLRERYQAALLASADGELGRASEALRDPAGARDLVVVGDSISAGANLEGGPGWVEILEASAPDRNISNIAVGGSSAMQWASERPDLTAALDAELARRPATMVVFLGGNDVLTYEAMTGDGVADAESLGRAVSGLFTVITRIRLLSPATRVVLGTYYDPFDGKSLRIPASMTLLGRPATQFQGTSRNVVSLNVWIYLIAYVTGAEVVDSYVPFMNHGYGNIWLGQGNVPYMPATFDVHPNTAGHEAIAHAYATHLEY